MYPVYFVRIKEGLFPLEKCSFTKDKIYGRPEHTRVTYLNFQDCEYTIDLHLDIIEREISSFIPTSSSTYPIQIIDLTGN